MPPPRPGTRPRTTKPWEKVKRPAITSELQITDGRHFGQLLGNIEIINSGVTSRKAREALFRLLARRVRAGRFLDLSSGNGIVGIEALSRGAMLGTFVERSARMCTCIKKNLAQCGVKEGHSEVIGVETLSFLKRMSRRRRFWDIVYCKAPAAAELTDYLKAFGNGTTVRPRGLLAIEHKSETSLPEKVGLLRRWRVVAKGDTTISVFERI
jgi:16S rRNA (guanine966-N2)-methyltransferase